MLRIDKLKTAGIEERFDGFRKGDPMLADVRQLLGEVPFEFHVHARPNRQT
jgi:hypothetical protein